MLRQLKTISNAKQSIFIISVVVLLAITFETFQQLYYIRRYELVEGITFFELVKKQAYRWVIWLLLSLVLVWTIKTLAEKRKTTLGILKIVSSIIGLVTLNIVIISISAIVLNNDVISFTNLSSEYIPFFMYQKAPMYTLGYIAISIILLLYFENEKLQVEIQELSELKLTNSKLYEQLRAQVDEKSTILNIKIGNKRKIIPVSHVCWIEADDYCVKVHTTNKKTYTMRSSLKALEEKLNTNFLRVHRKAIVNMNLAKELNLVNTPNVILQNDTKIPVSKRNLKTVKEFLSKY
ncbi:LytTR family DNA-binding domain-containing protein [uncultured Psychroserpens sp.]|uniref:LytR/AlgR family response regulator transcription factor n=1 Tax=uncultured Psychroserpens sp. TaxID=255436 RepID=UPI0026151EB0|nr:LytTR family DNA-binding domain-containing protein [uncultured Psychroserpens sp.]